MMNNDLISNGELVERSKRNLSDRNPGTFSERCYQDAINTGTYFPAVDAGPKWISVEERMPEVEKRVLVSITRHSLYKNKDYTLITCAIYEDGKVNVEDSCWTCEDGDYDEEADVSRVPQGWYEFHEYGNTEEDGIGLIGGDSCLVEKVTHWMPLPEPPKEG